MDPLNRLATASVRASALELAVVAIDAFFEQPQMCLQIPDRCRQRGQGLGELSGATAHLNRALRQHGAELRQQPADPIDRRSALLDEALAHPVQRSGPLAVRPT